MIKKETDGTIYLNRGDSTNEYNKLIFNYSYYDENSKGEKEYEFKPSDKISFVVLKKKGYTLEEIIKKEFSLSDIGYETSSKNIEIPLTSVETKKIPLKNKKQIFWYNVILNNNTTIVGFDEDGAKKVIVFPSTNEQE